MQELDVFVNDPFDASLLKHLFTSREDLHMASPHSTWPYSEKEWTETFAKNHNSSSLLFYLEGTIVGHTSFLTRDEDLYLCYVILHPDHRGKGYSEQLVTLSEEFCRLNYPEYQELHLNVNKGNERAKRLYEKMGYETYRDEHTKFKMKKLL